MDHNNVKGLTGLEGIIYEVPQVAQVPPITHIHTISCFELKAIEFDEFNT